MIRKENLLLPPEQQAGIKRLCDDFALWCETCCHIRDKDGNVAPLKPNRVQKRFIEFCRKQWEEEGRIRVVIVKGRQQGLSTICSAMVFHQLMQNGGKKAYIVAQHNDTAVAIFDMYRRIQDQLPEYLRPVSKYNSRAEMVFKELDSSIKRASGGGDAIGRGETLQYLHLTEVAYWPSATATDNMTAILNGVPKDKSIVFVESTANGSSGPYHDCYKGALAGENGFRVFFSAWYESDEYATEAPVGFAETMTFAELDLMKAHDLTINQMHWRRVKIGEVGHEKFEIDFPSTPEEAFKTSGAEVFDQGAIAKQRELAVKDFFKARVDLDRGDLEQVPYGELTIFKRHRKGETYTIGADVAEGIEHKHRDYSVAQILDGEGEQVAIWRGKIEPHEFGKVIDFLGRLYNNARVIVEKNMHGAAVLYVLNNELRYPNIYTQVVEAKRTSETTRRLGFHTTQNAKFALIDALRAAMREETIKINDRDTLDEMSVFVSDPKGKMGARKGTRTNGEPYHDDCVMALALAVHDLDRSWTPIECPDWAYESAYY